MTTKEQYFLNKEKIRAYNNEWKRNHPEGQQKYNRTLRGVISNRWTKMRERVEGKTPKGREKYLGLYLCPKDLFIEWASSDKALIELHRNWVLNNYSMKFSPSIDRIDSTKGYSIDNMQWMTHSENSRKRLYPKKEVEVLNEIQP